MNDRIESNGLEQVVAAVTRLSDVDGEGGRLVLAGRPVEELAGVVSFEQMVFRLWHGRDATAAEAETTRALLGDAREQAFELLPSLGDALALPDPMDSLRAAVAHLAEPAGPGYAAALRIVGAVAVFAAHWSRASEPLRPDPAAGHAADTLRLLRRRASLPAEVAALDAYLVTVIDHGMNASTFTARVVASTASDSVSAVTAALGALKGRLHGGAPGPVLDMLDAIGEAGAAAENARRARAWLEAELARGQRIMGMGHRVYRVRDPRAFVLERALHALEVTHAEAGARLALARAVEREAEALLGARHPERALRANVEFYTAVLLEALGVPRALFTPTFAISRVAGWLAHVAEQRAVGRLIRPQSRYVDVPPEAGVAPAERALA